MTSLMPCRFCGNPTTADVIMQNDRGEDLVLPACDHCARILVVISLHVGGRIGQHAKDLLTEPRR